MRTNRYGNQFTKAPKFKPPRDRRVEVRAVECPSCKAAVGAPCTKLDGTPGQIQHPGRRRLAIRMENLAREAEKEQS